MQLLSSPVKIPFETMIFTCVHATLLHESHGCMWFPPIPDGFIFLGVFRSKRKNPILLFRPAGPESNERWTVTERHDYSNKAHISKP